MLCLSLNFPFNLTNTFWAPTVWNGMSQAMEGYQAVLVREMALTLRKRTSDFSGLTQWRFISCCSKSAGNSLPPGDPGIQSSSILSSCHVLLLGRIICLKLPRRWKSEEGMPRPEATPITSTYIQPVRSYWAYKDVWYIGHAVPGRAALPCDTFTSRKEGDKLEVSVIQIV